jgi:LmbE family N-acetylglucosaminyl deacetylase
MRVLLTAAHPDDTEFICGGTVAALIGQGAAVTYLVVTSGEAGLPAGTADVAAREVEQLEAAQVLGVTETIFLRHSDGEVEANLELRSEIAAAIRVVRPDLLITHCPERNFKSVRFSHPDHLAVGQASLAAVYPDARNHRAFPALLNRGLEPYAVPEVWLHGAERPDFGFDITSSLESKVDAVRCHQTQLAEFGGNVEGFFRAWGKEVAEQQGMESHVFAEQYLRLDTR